MLADAKRKDPRHAFATTFTHEFVPDELKLDAIRKVYWRRRAVREAAVTRGGPKGL